MDTTKNIAYASNVHVCEMKLKWENNELNAQLQSL